MERRSAVKTLAAASAALASLGLWPRHDAEAQTQALSIALIGDTPYHQGEALHVEKILADIADRPIAFCLHMGDFKSGREVCSENLLSQRLELLSSFKRALFLSPGDNEWLDCHRAITGAWNPMERLEKLRELAFATDFSLGRQALAVQSQRAQGFPENQRWEAKAEGRTVLFASFNIPGSRDGWAGGSTADQIHERHAKNLAWLEETMVVAKHRDAPIVVLAAHADIEFVHNGIYAPWVAHLGRICRQFPGQILYLHGDSHRFAHDRPLYDAKGAIANLTRVESYGSPFSQFWVQIDIRPSKIGTREGPFTVTSRKIVA